MRKRPSFTEQPAEAAGGQAEAELGLGSLGYRPSGQHNGERDTIGNDQQLERGAAAGNGAPRPEARPAPAPEGVEPSEPSKQQQLQQLQQQQQQQQQQQLLQQPPALVAVSAAPQLHIQHDNGTVSEILDIPKAQVGKLIGRGGATISQMQASSGCSIQVDHTTPGSCRHVALRGAPHAVRAARAAIAAVLDSAGGGGGEPGSVAGEGEVTQTISCPQSIVGRVIGRGGETIRSLQQASGAHILVNQEFPEGVDRQVSITGPPAGVERAIAMMRELMSGEPGTASSIISRVAQQLGIGVTRSVACPRSIVGRIIGKGGDTIKGLQRKYSASIQIDQSKDPMLVTITAPPHQAGPCEQEVRAIMSDEVYGERFGMAAAPSSSYTYGAAPTMARPTYGAAASFTYPGFAIGTAPGFSYAAPGFGAPYGFGPYGAYSAMPAQPGFGVYGAPAAGGGAAAGYAGRAAGAPSTGGGGYATVMAPGVWQALQDEQGRTFYYNPQTGQSQWEKPGEAFG